MSIIARKKFLGLLSTNLMSDSLSGTPNLVVTVAVVIVVAAVVTAELSICGDSGSRALWNSNLKILYLSQSILFTPQGNIF